MKKYLFILSSLIFPAIASAHGAEGIAEDGSSISHQIEEISPFYHFSEGHWLVSITLVVLWLSFVYVVYSLLEKFNKPKQ